MSSQLYFEKAVGLFLPELFSRWADRGTNHIACIVLFSRLLYEEEELPLVDGGDSLARDPQGRPYRDVYKVRWLVTPVTWLMTTGRLRL
jgi:hypothetical protein